MSEQEIEVDRVDGDWYDAIGLEVSQVSGQAEASYLPNSVILVHALKSLLSCSGGVIVEIE